MKYWFIYTTILHRRLCFFLLNLSKVYFEVRKHTFSIVNHPTDHEHFYMELLLQSLYASLRSPVSQVTICPKNLWIRHCLCLKCISRRDHFLPNDRIPPFFPWFVFSELFSPASAVVSINYYMCCFDISAFWLVLRCFCTKLIWRKWMFLPK